jgi:hypothetical protein
MQLRASLGTAYADREEWIRAGPLTAEGDIAPARIVKRERRDDYRANRNDRDEHNEVDALPLAPVEFGRG